VFSLLALLAPAFACEPVDPLPDVTQVAWISPLNDDAGANTWLEVVRVSDLRAWIHAKGKEPDKVLHAVGMVGRKDTVDADDRYKITIFDVKKEWLCRPIDGQEGVTVSGVPICEDRQQRALRGHRPGYTGCGYSLDTGASVRGLDVFRIEWSSASTLGFCTMPLERFLDGA
jgi:hypothetical protein